MARKENMEFLASIYSTSVKKNKTIINLDDYDALLTWLFGKEKTIAVCAEKAYRDLQRNLRGIAEMPKKEEYKSETYNKIASCIDELLKMEVCGREEFDTWHHESCQKIRELSNKHNIPKWVKWMERSVFPYGLAQKWLNMTIKNMLVMEKWNDELDKIRKQLHAPVDSYVLQAASEMLGIKIINKQGQLSLYKEGITKPWSKWGYSDYVRFQEELRNAVECSMDWEFDAWNKTKDKRK